MAWLAARLAPLLLCRPPSTGGTPPLSLEVRLDAVAAVLLDGLSYRRAGRMVGISKTEVGDSMDLLLGPLAGLGFCRPDGTFITTLDELGQWLGEMAASGEAVVVDGLATRVQRPRGWANQKVLYDAKRHAHTAQGLALSTIHGDLLWCGGGWPGSCHEHELIELAGLQGVLDGVEVPSLLDRGFRGLAKTRQHWHAPVGDRRTKDRLTQEQRAFNRVQAGLRALVEQSIAHLAGAWALRRWRGLLYRVRDVYRAAGALICLGRWLHRVPTVTRAPRTPSITIRRPPKATSASRVDSDCAACPREPHSLGMTPALLECGPRTARGRQPDRHVESGRWPSAVGGNRDSAHHMPGILTHPRSSRGPRCRPRAPA